MDDKLNDHNPKSVNGDEPNELIASNAMSVRHPNAETLVKVNFLLKNHQVYSSKELDLAQTEVVHEYISTAKKSLFAARNRMARIAKIETTSLPIAIGLDNTHLEVSILLPHNIVPLEKRQLLRSLGRQAKASTDSALSELAKLPRQTLRSLVQVETAAPSRLSAGSVPGAPEAVSNPFDKVAAGLVTSLNGKKRPGELVVSVTAGDVTPPGGSFTITRPEIAARKAIAFSTEPEEVLLTICGRLGRGLCTVKEAGTTARVRARFGTAGPLLLQLRMVEGLHPVRALVRRCISDASSPAQDIGFHIDCIQELDTQWAGDTGGLAILQKTLDRLHDLLPKPVQVKRGRALKNS
ncbi:MAG TPA: hypothetical protein PLL01_07125 [Rhodoferax sp.]|nr:hypothetical protein [Rhodoferax sp.]